MRASVAFLSVVATTATALPILDTVGGLVSNLLGKIPSGAAPEDVLHLVWTNVKADEVLSLSVLDGAAENVLAHTCGDKLIEGAFNAVPVDFSQVTPEGLGSFVYGDAVYEVEQVLAGGVATVACVQKNLPDTAVLDCVVPVVAGLVLPVVSEVTEIVTCLTSDLPLIGDLPVLAALPL